MGLEPLKSNATSKKTNLREQNLSPSTPSLQPTLAPNPVFQPLAPKPAYVSPAANEDSLALYGSALENLQSGRKHEVRVARYAEITSFDVWAAKYQQEIFGVSKKPELATPQPILSLKV